MMEEHEEHADKFADDDDMRIDADYDRANAFEDDLNKLVENMKPEACRDVNALVAVMDLVKSP
jgi:archaellum component FlaC